MAITANGTIKQSAATIPAGYTIPVLNPFVAPADKGQYTVELSITNADAADPVIGITNVVAAAETHFETTHSAVLKLDAAQTITANLTILKCERTNTNASIFVAGVEVFKCTISYEYE